MASTVTAATLTVTITESITLNGSDQGATNSFTVASVNEVSKRIVTVPANNDVTVATFAAATSSSVQAFDVNDVKYIRVTNLDDTNTINLALIGASDNAQFVVQPKQSFILGKPDDCMLGEADTTPALSSFEDLASILVDSGANAVDVEVLIASV